MMIILLQVVGSNNFSSKFEELAKKKGRLVNLDIFTPLVKAQAKQTTKTPAMDTISPCVQFAKDKIP